MEEKKTQQGSVLTEGIIDITLNDSKVNLADICKKEGENLAEFVTGMGEGDASGEVRMNTGGKAVIKLQIEAAMLFERDNQKGIFEKQIQPGEDYYKEALVRIFLLISEFIMYQESNWLILGHVKSNQGGKIPIVMIYSPVLQKCFYSMKRKADIISGHANFPGFNPN